MRGDWVEIAVDVGDGVKTYTVEATKAGRRVEIATSRGVVDVSEVTRTGVVVRTARFMATRVVALVEHPGSEPVPAAATAPAVEPAPQASLGTAPGFDW